MKLKYLVVALAAVVFSAPALHAQTPEEIVQKMSEQMDRCEAEGFTMDLIMKIPILGEFRTHNLSYGDKLRMEMNKNNFRFITWSDKQTQWEYDPEKNEITITKADSKPSKTEEKSDLSAFDSLTDGYDLTLKSEDANTWYITCKKSKSNKTKDDPKQIDLAVLKSTYLPLYLKTKQSGITVSIENTTLGVTESEVTFNPAEFPNAKIIDKR